MKNTWKMMGSILLATTLFSCGSSGKPASPDGEVEINIPCSGSQYFSNEDYFRANASGESLDQMTAKKKALANAKAQLAGDIQTTIKSVADNYVKSSEFNNKEEALERFEQNARSIINQKLRGIRQICEKAVRVSSSGKYKHYIAIELSGDELFKSYSETLSKDQALKVDYNYDKFKDTFDKEMDKLDKEQSN